MQVFWDIPLLLLARLNTAVGRPSSCAGSRSLSWPWESKPHEAQILFNCGETRETFSNNQNNKHIVRRTFFFFVF